MQSVFLHIDLDAFFASVEQLDHPEWRGKPVIVGGKPGDRRSVVSTASYEARKFGVHSAMPIVQAVKLCPQGIYVHGNMERYHQKSQEVMAIFHNYSPDVQQMSVDEAFIDLTGTERLFGSPEESARRIKSEVKEKTGLTVSVGIASSKYLAKIASGLKKPDGLFTVPFGGEEEFMLNLPLDKVWGIGKKSLARLQNAGLRTTREIHRHSLTFLTGIMGPAGGSFLYNTVRGLENDTFQPAKTHSISSESTYPYDLVDRDVIDTALLELCYTVMFRLLREKARSHSLCIKIRYEDFTTVSIQEGSDRDFSSVDDLFERAKTLFYKKYESGRGIRLLGVAAQNLEDSSAPRQADLFDFGEEKKRKVEEAILKQLEKNPAIKITKARMMRD
ncbi:MAG: DNA polymerase IV [Treponema sp.]|nr:DNA polymerase IV [Treponema sp.]